MRLLVSSKNAEMRKRIIKSIKAPYSKESLLFMSKRIRDVNIDVVVTIFKQLTSSKTPLSAFESIEARMLILTEGLTSENEEIRNACISYIEP